MTFQFFFLLVNFSDFRGFCLFVCFLFCFLSPFEVIGFA